MLKKCKKRDRKERVRKREMYLVVHEKEKKKYQLEIRRY